MTAITRPVCLIKLVRRLFSFEEKLSNLYQSQAGDRRPRHRSDPIENRKRIPIDDYDTLQPVPCSLIANRLIESFPRRAQLNLKRVISNDQIKIWRQCVHDGEPGTVSVFINFSKSAALISPNDCDGSITSRALACIEEPSASGASKSVFFVRIFFSAMVVSGMKGKLYEILPTDMAPVERSVGRGDCFHGLRYSVYHSFLVAAAH